MPYAWIIIVILWSVINAVNKSKKKQAQAQLQKGQEQSRQKTAEQYARQQAQQQTPAKPAPAPTPQPAAMSRQDDWDDEEENWDERDAQRIRPSVAAPSAQPKPAKRHETKPLVAHMHTPVMGVEGEGTEGVDCCHEYMLDQPAAAPADFLPMQEETEALRAKALLQGVIFSEVLGRRHPKRYGPRRA